MMYVCPDSSLPGCLYINCCKCKFSAGNLKPLVKHIMRKDFTGKEEACLAKQLAMQHKFLYELPTNAGLVFMPSADVL